MASPMDLSGTLSLPQARGYYLLDGFLVTIGQYSQEVCLASTINSL